MTRDVANWFHGREGELFTQEETPFDREQIVALTNDSVDPVQQITTKDGRYYGVIAYDEHDGWYEYTRYDDAIGQVRIGVCGACVASAESADEVARTLSDDTGVAESKMQQHYRDEHSESPDEIQTGATLLSGTTINGNETIHLGMDGAGSGVDADTIRGNEALELGEGYISTESIVLSQFASPSSDPQGIGLDSSDSLWHSDFTNSIYQLNQRGIVLSQFASPSSSPVGIGLDSSDSLWHTDSSAISIYQLNQSGSVLSQFASPNNSPQGIGLDSSDSLWHADATNAFFGFAADSIYQLNQSGSVLSQFAPPSGSPTGIGLDSSDSLWHTDSSADSIYQLNQSGSVLSQFTSPSNSPQGIGLDSSDSLWHADNSAGSIYQLAQSTFIEFQ